MTAKVAVFSLKDRVINPTFGCGTITQVDSQYTTIAFDDHGTKKFLTSQVQLELSDVPSPRKSGRAAKTKIPEGAR